MKNLIYITLMVLGLYSCNIPEEKYQKTENIYLRQLVKTDEVTKNTSASYFLVMGSASSSEEVETKIKLMGKVNGFYRLIEFNFLDVRIKIDNKIDKPYLYINYRSYEKYSVAELLGYRYYDIRSYVIVCPEKYLPEQLLPISL
jgi:hypothetical protein